MNTIFLYFKLEWKQYMKVIPPVLVQSILFGIMILALGVYASQAVYGETVIGQIRVGIVSEEENRLSGMLTGFVQSMESVKDNCSFQLMTREEAERSLEQGDIYAAILIPRGMLEGILNGNNIPAQVLINHSFSQMEAEVFMEMTEAGDRLLGTAQAGIYAFDDLLRETGRQDLIQETEDELNAAYLKYALNRNTIFKITEVNAVKGGNIVEYYCAALLFAFLSFTGLSMGKLATVHPQSIHRILNTKKPGMAWQYIIEAGAYSAAFAVLGTGASFLTGIVCLNRESATFSLSGSWGLLFFIWFGTGIFIRMLIQITGKTPGGLGISFIISITLMLGSGIFIPQAFLPEWFAKAGNMMPYKMWMEGLLSALQGKYEWIQGMWLAVSIAVSLLIGTAGYLWNSKRENQ